MGPALVAREYLLLGLRCDRLVPGLVDSDTGALALRRQVAREGAPTPAALVAQARWLRTELPRSELGEARRDFLDRQLVALECSMRRAAGAPLGFRAEVRAYFDTDIGLGTPERYRAAHTDLDAVLPGRGPLAPRMAAYRTAEKVPASLLAPAVQALSGALAALAGEHIGLPAGQAVYYEVVRDRPWSALHTYLGRYRSRVAVNADSEPRLAQLARLVAHEAYPGHHTERCRAESALVDDPPPGAEPRPEQALFLVNTPQCLLSEGLADLGLDILVGRDWGEWASRVLAGLGLRLDGELAERVDRASAALLPVRQDAALMLHDLGAGEREVLEHLRRWLLVSEPRARQMLGFLTHPLWRAYTTTYVEGHRLVRAWLDGGPVGEPSLARYLRVLDGPLTPSAIRAELPSATTAAMTAM